MGEMLNAGDKVLIRTVTNYWTGQVVDVNDQFVRLVDAAWIADTGRFADCFTKGPSEVEPIEGPVLVAVGAIVDVCQWTLDLPRKQK